MKFTFRDIVWIALIVLIVVALSKCHRDDNDKLNNAVKKLQDKHTADSLAYKSIITVQESKVESSVKKADSLSVINKSLEAKLDDNAANVMRLSAALRKAKTPGLDTNLITVDHDYIDYCDSLAFKASDLAVDYSKYKSNTNNLLAAKDETIKGKDDIIATERKAKQNCLDDYNAITHFYRDYIKANKPTNQIYIGAELIGNPAYLINNAGLAITLKTKSNKLWQLSGGIQTNGQYYARINGNILIKLKP